MGIKTNFNHNHKLQNSEGTGHKLTSKDLSKTILQVTKMDKMEVVFKRKNHPTLVMTSGPIQHNHFQGLLSSRH
jgi:hypothetical protein